MITLTEQDMWFGIGQPELEGRAAELVEFGQTEPIAMAITDGLGIIKIYVDPRVLPDDVLRRVWRILAVCWIYNRLGTLPPKRKEEQDWAYQFLEDVRDGKFPNLVVDETLIPDGSGSGTWGSNEAVNFSQTFS